MANNRPGRGLKFCPETNDLLYPRENKVCSSGQCNMCQECSIERCAGATGVIESCVLLHT
eukprot:1157675-Pelagomonas_calceolata.AAC.3